MANITPTDILDEDAADLQFPKDDLDIEDSCGICKHTFVYEPKILCAECPSLKICLQCFALGLETIEHQNNHRYQVDRRDIPSDDSSWSPQEDYDLLSNINEFGYGNDIDLGKRVPQKTILQIRQRTDELCGLDVAPLQACLEESVRPLVPYDAETPCEEPPRYPMNSMAARALGGYSAPRGDFQSELDDGAEAYVAALEDIDPLDSDSLDVALTTSIVAAYNDRLRERCRWKKVVRDNGLLLRKFPVVMARYDMRLRVFMQVMAGEQFELLLEGLNMEDSFKKELRRLSIYRERGVTRLATCQLYERLEQMRNEGKRQLTEVRFSSSNPTAKRRPTKLEICHFPGYSILNAKERELCSIHRIIPEIYFKVKKLLIDESNARGGIQLKTARLIAKMDVNKTRKLYDYLMIEGLITKEN